ncbi:UTP--glucose-1-phosphate uridylyltransferase GalU [Methanococcus voltae]|uniref:UTP--glucose-1-phosphate uridylyltransferase n=2 Tax=Methanococcus voltae TaxID=2188 RepID=A0A8J7UQS8_METVO|nr:UTP--glucose-1-phosphate uridylyltransferase GalU [Methanococcus voltae]MBP2171957.1 UTP--glucose-1-phosphate uridylyltransferase [Methanococcus voltae]MBP2201088.1 UTP--glucose-1-phosphate uridylyltransferase [Methanococcus voltae]MCS3921811.1 UTP--glucose-1-phosphate uridylyltransferase [Methanococcus voltae PS]
MVKKAIIPAAGFGTRLLPITKAQPKEMLPVLGKPIIQYVIEDLAEAGISDVMIVTGKGKYAIENHFDKNFELEERLKKDAKCDALKAISDINNLATIYYTRQGKQLGLGHAIGCGSEFVGDEYSILMVGDTIYSKNVAKELMNAHEKYGCSVIALERVPMEDVSKYGVIAGEQIEEGIYNIHDLVEKPPVSEAPSNLIITGAYLLSPKIFEHIKNTEPGRGNEIQLTDAMKTLLNEEKIIGIELNYKRYDIGDIKGWLEANVELGLENIPGFKEYLKSLCEEGINKK